ncbi:MAG TPA: hypothetical protein VHO47_02805 [Candidatus Babeliales bacterium]|nr:hypothetical protein [Candidatus Babeliales bacterium]
MKKILSLLMISTLVTNVALSNDFLKSIQTKAENYASNMYAYLYKTATDKSAYQENAGKFATFGTYAFAAKSIFKYGMNKTAPKANQQTFGTMPNRLFRYSYNVSAKALPATMITSLGFGAAHFYNKWKNA